MDFVTVGILLIGLGLPILFVAKKSSHARRNHKMAPRFVPKSSRGSRLSWIDTDDY